MRTPSTRRLYLHHITYSNLGAVRLGAKSFTQPLLYSFTPQ
nr:MAG TPA: hypothetical protein [Caudoviricetes sp.]